MKVLHVINSLATGGAEKLIIEILPLLNDDIQADLVLLNASEHQFYIELKQGNLNFKIHELSMGSVYNPFLIFKLYSLFKKYDLIHVHLFPSQYWAVFAKIFIRKKIVMIFTEHNTSNRRLRNPNYRLVDKLIYCVYDKIVCISPGVKRQLLDILKISDSKLMVIPNGINGEKIEKSPPSSRADFGYYPEDKIIVQIAGFRIEKDHATVIKTLAKLPPVYKLLLIGDGEKRDEIEKQIINLNVSSRVQLLGVRPDVYSILKMCDLAVVSSHWEGFGLVAAEAMCTGIPVIASNVDGVAQVVEDGGILFELGNVDDLRSKILDVTQNSQLSAQLITSGLLKSKNYDIRNMVKQLTTLYKECI